MHKIKNNLKKLFNKIIQLHEDFKNSDLKTALKASISKDIERWPYRYMEDVDEAIENSQMWFVNRKSWMDKAVTDMYLKAKENLAAGIDVTEYNPNMQHDFSEEVYSITGMKQQKLHKGLNIIKSGKNHFSKALIR